MEDCSYPDPDLQTCLSLSVHNICVQTKLFFPSTCTKTFHYPAFESLDVELPDNFDMCLSHDARDQSSLEPLNFKLYTMFSCTYDAK